MILGSGFDHTYVLKEAFDSELLHAAKATGDLTGIVLDVYTDRREYIYTPGILWMKHIL